MSKIDAYIESLKKKKPKSRSLLLEFEKIPQLYRWLGRQAHLHGCSKTAYVKALIEMDRKQGGKK